jgi:hypothetical protein
VPGAQVTSQPDQAVRVRGFHDRETGNQRGIRAIGGHEPGHGARVWQRVVEAQQLWQQVVRKCTGSYDDGGGTRRVHGANPFVEPERLEKRVSAYTSSQEDRDGSRRTEAPQTGGQAHVNARSRQP